MVPEKVSDNSMDGVSKKRGDLKENDNIKDTYTHNQKETAANF